MKNFLFFIKRLLITAVFFLLLPFHYPAYALATDSTSVMQSANKPTSILPASTLVWAQGVLQDIYAPCTGSPPICFQVVQDITAPNCPTGLKPYINIAFRHGYYTQPPPWPPAPDKGVRGYHLKLAQLTDGSYIMQISSSKMRIIFAQAYLDVIDADDKAIDVSYWIYCAP